MIPWFSQAWWLSLDFGHCTLLFFCRVGGSFALGYFFIFSEMFSLSPSSGTFEHFFLGLICLALLSVVSHRCTLGVTSYAIHLFHLLLLCELE